MASIIRRGRSWRAMIVRKGQRVSATFDTQAEARAWATKAEAAILAGERAAPATAPASPRQTIADLIDRYAREVSPSKRCYRWERIRAATMVKVPAFCVPIAEFGAIELAAWRDDRARDVAPASVNRDLNFLSSVFKHAIREWRAPIGHNPVSLIRRLKPPAPRRRRVSLTERAAIVAACGWDGASRPDTAAQWAAFAFCLALETAMRKGEILSLRWGAVDFDRRFAHLALTKNGDDRDVPLSISAIALMRIAGPRADDDRVVPVLVGSLDKFFRRARMRAGLMDIRFHDSRREATTQMSKKLANVLELGAVTGHRSMAVLRDYYRPDPTDLAKKLG